MRSNDCNENTGSSFLVASRCHYQNESEEDDDICSNQQIKVVVDGLRRSKRRSFFLLY